MRVSLTTGEFLVERASALKEIYQKAKDLSRIESRLTKKTIFEMTDSITWRDKSGESPFLMFALPEGLEETPEQERNAIINQVNLRELADEIYGLIIKHLADCGYFRKQKKKKKKWTDL